jgi:hypothetical protein
MLLSRTEWDGGTLTATSKLRSVDNGTSQRRGR